MREGNTNNLTRKDKRRREKTVTRDDNSLRLQLYKIENLSQFLSREMPKLREKSMCITMMICFLKFSSLRFTRPLKKETKTTR